MAARHPDRKASDAELSSTKAKRPRRDPGEIIAVVRRVLSENGRDYLPQYLFAIGCLLAIAATTAFSAWIMRDVVDEIFYRRRADLIAVICGAIALAFVIRGAALYGQAVVLAKIGNNLVARYQQRLFDHLMKLGVGYFSETRSAHLAAQINQNVNGIRDLLGLTITSVARDAVSLLALIGVMLWQDWILSAIALLIGPPLVYTVNYLMRRLRRITRESVEVNSRLIGAMQEATQGITIVKAFTMEGELSAKLAALIGHAEAQANKIARVSERLSPIAEMLAGFAVAGVIGYAGYRALYGNQPPGAVFSFITALLLAYDPARRLARSQVTLERSLVNARMIYEILDIEPHQGDAPGALPLKVGQGEVRFDHVSFAYHEGTPVLDDVSFTAAAGKTTAIVGGSGAGKTTLIALLQRFYDVGGGSLAIDGQDIAKVTKQTLRGSIAYVSQQPYLFEGTIRDNIRYGRPGATDAEVEQAAKIAQADEFIRQQPHGYETAVGENGLTLSGGQRQRLSIARAIVRNAPILVLDEATSALDNESEARVQAALAEVMKNRTTIVIAHRLSTVINADHIVVLAHGQLVEEGTHHQLIADPHGVYARFHGVQPGKHTDGGLGLIDDTKVAPIAVARRKRGKA
jgi:ATP-binding cassette, subfamily B, bacterial MsbA